INGIVFARIGYVTADDNFVMTKKDKEIVKLSIKKLTESYGELGRVMNNTENFRRSVENKKK
ncbi:MAG: hypothetical protein M3222_00595, partial [Thermoproteota archaeon]|nr:hypothetical protein [Thermoproteota archaeon]